MIDNCLINKDLIDRCLIDHLKAQASTATLENLVIGVNWILAQSGQNMGLCFSVRQIPRTIPWAGTLLGQPITELAAWLKHESVLERSVALAAINSCVNVKAASLSAATQLTGVWPAHLRVFEYFKPLLSGQKVVVVGHYPSLELYWHQDDYQCLELNPQQGDISAEHSEAVLSQAQWVFITASSIANASFTELLQFSRHAKVVLMGPSLTWLDAEVWRNLGVNYLAGVQVEASAALWHTVAQAGGTRIFETGVSYFLLPL